MPMSNRAVIHVGTRDKARAQRADKLVEEHGHAVFDFCCGRRRKRPARDFGPAADDELVPVLTDEFVQHWRHKHDTSTAAMLFTKAQGPLSNLIQHKWLGTGNLKAGGYILLMHHDIFRLLIATAIVAFST